jgi:hypothetical protein
VEYFLSDYLNNILNVFAFFGDAGVTYLVKCREYPLSVQKETTECGFDRKKSVTGIQREFSGSEKT